MYGRLNLLPPFFKRRWILSEIHAFLKRYLYIDKQNKVR